MKNVLYVEDKDKDFVDYSRILDRRGFNVIRDISLRNALARILPSQKFAFFVLDVYLPDVHENTNTIVPKWRRSAPPQFQQIPILMLTVYWDPAECAKLSEEQWPRERIAWCSKQTQDPRALDLEIRSHEKFAVFNHWIDIIENSLLQ